MQHLFTIVAVAALASLQNGVFGAKISRSNILNTLDNEIPINDPIPADDGRRIFVEIEVAPIPARHNAGSNTELECQAMGHPSPHIQWLKNDMPILEDELETNEIIEVSQSSLASVHSILVIIAVSPNKEDVYTCVAQSAMKTAEASAKVYNAIESLPSTYSSISTLNRHLLSLPQKPRITQYAKTYMGDVNTSLLLPCRATGNPAPEIYWHDKDNHLIVNRDSRIRVLESGELLISPALWADMGSYTCTAKNAYGKESVSTFFYPVIKDKSNYKRSRQH